MINFKENTQFDISELNRRLANLFRIGTVEEVRYDKEGKPSDPEVPWFSNEDQNGLYRGPLYRVRMHDHFTYWIPQLQLRAGEDQSYFAYEKGEQVAVFSLSGDPMQGVIFGALPSDKYRPPVGLDDLSKDLRPWRESIDRKRYKDDHDNREDRSPRKKETNSDKIGIPPRHLWQWDFHGKSQYQYIHDEDTKTIHNHQSFDDDTVLEFSWNYENQTHTHHWHYADGADYRYHYDEKAKTHSQEWFYPDGRILAYFWDEKNQAHYKTHTHADGQVYKQHWNEAAQTHLKQRTYPDGRIERYFWNEKNDLHESKTTHADGRIETQSSQGGNSLKRIEFADGTVQTYRHGDTNTHETQYKDGSFVVYDLDTQEMHSHSAKVLKASAVEKIQIKAPKVFIEGDVGIKGNVSVNGDISNTGNITSDGVHKAASHIILP